MPFEPSAGDLHREAEAEGKLEEALEGGRECNLVL